MQQRLIARMKTLLIKKGFKSSSSKIGVQVRPLANYLGVSVQAARKYFINDAMPDLKTLIRIANFLEVSPVFLVFGIKKTTNNKQRFFEIKKQFVEEIFEWIFKDVLKVELEEKTAESIYTFLYGIMNDIAQLDSNDDTKLRLIKMAISSAKSSASIMENVNWQKKSKEIA